jgi:hypothetical protein
LRANGRQIGDERVRSWRNIAITLIATTDDEVGGDWW